ncbi:MAG: hybrid sensor histidine kinase/response regulator [Leptospiraceae bacterium]|nr:hybrid sensor histidine kinase/response regulator [Leptospiraceae bacterium]
MRLSTEEGILIIDDNPLNLSVLGQTLKEAGFKVTIANSGKSGIYAAQKQMPELILLDIQMPEMDGFETCKLLKEDEKTKQIPIIFLTAFNNKSQIVQGFEYGAVDYITKPFDKNEVISRIKNHICIYKLQSEIKYKNTVLTTLLEKEKELNKIRTNFISIVSHDLKTPLAVINTANEFIREEYSNLPNFNLHYNDLISKSIKKINSILNRASIFSLANSSQVVLTYRNTNLKDFCQNMINEFLFSQSNKERIEFICEGENFNYSIDSNIVYHIFSNIISNALKYSNENTSIICTLKETGTGFIFSVKDKGVGISKEDQEKIFEDYFRGSNTSSINGTGIGLAIVKKLTHLHGGRLEVESKINEGTCFRIIIDADTLMDS